MTSQHRRGGKHAVKDHDLTHTKYDDYSRDQLLAAVKEARCYVKDEKKSVMARKLVDHDRKTKSEEIRALRERKEKAEQQQQDIQEAAKARHIRRRARAERNRERKSRREDEENVSSNSDDTEDLDEREQIDAHRFTVIGGEVLSDVSWEDTCSETTVRSVNPRVTPGRRLRLFEWPYITKPSTDPPADHRFELFPSAITYTPVKLVTMHTQEKLTLPGSKYPAGVEPDFVPILDPLIRTAARHGHTIGLLAHATIERATSWAARTIVPGWNGRMYFALPQPSPTKLELDTVFSRCSTDNSKLLQPTPGAIDIKLDRKLRSAQRTSNKRKRTIEVYEASKWRPLALAYMPAYLDWEKDLEYESPEDAQHTLMNLFYIRFTDCNLPHYYFWTKEGEWSDPTTPDPLWTLDSGRRNGVDPVMHVSPTKIRIRNLIPSPGDSLCEELEEPTVESVEQDLSKHGLPATLAKAQRYALSIGQECEWIAFTRRLAVLYPSGVLPCAPPTISAEDVCLAEKIAGLLEGREVQPFSGEERWTRDDDEFWDVVSRPASSSPTISQSILTSNQDASEEHSQPSPSPQTSSDDEDGDPGPALYRRDSIDAPFPRRSFKPTPHQTRDPRVLSWLANQPLTFPSILLPLPSPRTPYLPEGGPPISPLDLNFTKGQGGTSETCPFCSAPWIFLSDIEKTGHMLAHSAPSLLHPLMSRLEENSVQGVGVDRRESMYVERTLGSYHYHTNLKTGRGTGWGSGTGTQKRIVIGKGLDVDEAKGDMAWDGDDESCSRESTGRKRRRML